MDLVFIVCVLALAALVVGVISLQRRRRHAPLPLVAKDVLSAREREFHRLLMMQYPGHHIFAQYALSQLLDVRPGTADPQSVRNRFNQLVADFVLCRADYSVVAVIELDERDARKDSAVRSAGLRLVRVPNGPLPNGVDLRRLVEGEGVAAETLNDPLLGVADSSRVLLGAAAIALLIIGGATVYWNMRASPVGHRALVASAPTPAPAPPMARARATHKPVAAMPAGRPPLPQPASPSSASNAEPPVGDSTVSGDKRVLEAKNKKKEEAWAAYYKPYPSCEHPGTWEEQVECGNRYIRARREFDKQWDAAHAASR